LGRAWVCFNMAVKRALSAALVALAVLPRAAHPEAVPVAPRWNETPAERLSETRERMVLNDVWRFEPARGPSEKAPAGEWGLARVPGTWAHIDWPQWTMDGVLLSGKGGSWEGWNPGECGRAWYEREITIPAGWAGREVALAIDRVSTDAEVFLDGAPCGEVRWPGGEVVLTPLAQPGRKHLLRILVIATGDRAAVEGLVNADKPVRDSLQTRGLIGDVTLEARPMETRLDGFFVKTSVRKRELSLDIELRDVAEAGPVTFTAEILDSRGKRVKRWKETVTVEPDRKPAASFTWAWKDPVLWDFLQPSLYTMVVNAEGKGWRDQVVDRFGFREFRIEGKGFLLNERPFNLRPMVWLDSTSVAGMRECMGGVIDGLAKANFNLLELWPEDDLERGTPRYRDEWAEVADTKGLPLMFPATAISSFVPMGDAWDMAGTPEKWAAWEKVMAADWKRHRNRPSIVILVSTANTFGFGDDQNPRRIGNSKSLAGSGTRQKRDQSGARMVETIRKLDPTRPVTSHHGGAVGDFQTCNTYLCLTPLQEREEWPSAWAASGDKPFMAVEFGTPLSTSFERGRGSYGAARNSEPLVTEYCAIYLGGEAYRLEKKEYRDMIAGAFRKDQEYGGTGGWVLDGHPAHQKVQALFDRNTWRSWRTWGMTGGMIPWEWGHGWRPRGEMVRMPEWKPGQAGTYALSMDWSQCRGFSPDGGMEELEPGKVIREGNSPVLAWIAGPAGEFTAKDHNYYGGETLRKQVALVNSGTVPVPWDVEWTVSAAGKITGSGKAKGTIGVEERLFVPVEAVLPKVPGKAGGAVTLRARVGSRDITDEFGFRVFPRVVTGPRNKPVLSFDPSGTTLRMLFSLGWSATAWDGKPAPGALLVIGRGALGSGRPLPGPVDAFAAAGGRVVIFGQDPEWLRKHAGFRVARHVSRRAFGVASRYTHPMLAGLDDEDLRDWRGAGTLFPETMETDLPKDNEDTPAWGYHWGNRGSVSGGAIEKPHHSGWTPILEGEFDLAYTPLMELSLGKGLVVWCQLDLEGRTVPDPVADHMVARIMDYAEAVRRGPRAPACWYLGGKQGAGFLKSLGMSFRNTEAVPKGPGLLVVGPDGKAGDPALERFLESGGKVLFMPRKAGKLPLGFAAVSASSFAGSTQVPEWNETAGVSASDLRLRCEIAAAPLTAPAGEVAADGILGRREAGKGVAVFTQLAPWMLDAERKTYMRYSSWRTTRLLTQLLADLGAEFAMDRKGLDFEWRSRFEAVPLAGKWKCMVEKAIKPSDSAPNREMDAGNKGFGRGWARPSFDDGKWKEMSLPTLWETQGAEWQIDGAVWFRRTVTVPASWAGKDLELQLGPIDDFDTTYFNGTKVGVTDRSVGGSWWALTRKYSVPGRLVKAGKNTVAVRVFDHFGGGGIGGRPEDQALMLKEKPAVDFYVPGFREDWALGDDPYRYYRW